MISLTKISPVEIELVAGNGICLCRGSNKEIMGGWGLAPGRVACEDWCCSGSLPSGLGIIANIWGFGTTHIEAMEDSVPCRRVAHKCINIMPTSQTISL